MAKKLTREQALRNTPKKKTIKKPKLTPEEKAEIEKEDLAWEEFINKLIKKNALVSKLKK